MQFRKYLINKGKHKYIILFLWLALPTLSYSQNTNTAILKDSVVKEIDSTSNTIKDSIKLISKKQKPNQIDAEINYKAKDSIVFLGNGTGLLHGETDITYKSINLKADFVRVKMDSSLIFAHGTIDSLGARIGDPVFNEGNTDYNSKELTYNLRTKKGYIRQAVTQEGEGFIISDRTKKTDTDVLCIAGGKYTTCDNHDHPDFYLSLTKGKVKPGSYVVSGPAYLVVQDVPLPIIIPFGFFPFTDKYSSGILMPTFEDELTRGFGLKNGGYYFAINDYMDMEIRGDIYSKGTWAMNATTTYRKRYKYSGNFNFDYREDVTGEKDLADYSKRNSLSIRWSHSQDAKANPFRTLSASVNFATSGYNQNNINTYANTAITSQNTSGSSISFSQRFPESPFNLSGSVLINQISRDSTINLSLPNISISMSRIYPLKRKNAVGKERWYEKISMSYSGTLANSITTKEYKLLSSSLSKDWKNGMKHSIPVSASFNILKYINISPSIQYNERWYLTSISKSWDNAKQEVVIDTINGFNRVYDFSTGVSASTKLYGFFIPIRSIFGDKIDRIRHVVTPSIGLSYRPDFGESQWGFWDTMNKTIIDKNSLTGYRNEEVLYSRYEGSLYGSPETGKSGNVNFSVGNNIEMKVRNDKDTTGTKPFNTISLIDNLSVSGSYNMAADSMKWSNFSSNIRIKIGKSYSLSLSGAFDPYRYALNSQGEPVRVNQLRWNHGQLPRFLGTSTSYSYTLNNETFKKIFKGKTAKGDSKENSTTETNAENDQTVENTPSDNPAKNGQKISEDGYTKLAIPWSISLNYSIRYSQTNEFNYNKMDYKMDFTHNFSASGNLALTDKWKMNASTSYEFKTKEFTSVSINITRDLHCWSMSGSMVPFGRYKSYSFRIGVNSSMLADLKYDKQSGYSSNNTTWY